MHKSIIKEKPTTKTRGASLLTIVSTSLVWKWWSRDRSIVKAMFMQTCFCKCYKGDTYKLYHSYIWRNPLVALPITWKLISLFVLRGARAGFPRYPLKAAAMFAFRSARNLCLSWLWNYIAAISVITGCPPRLFHRRYIVISYRSFTPTSLKQTLYEYVARRWAI